MLIDAQIQFGIFLILNLIFILFPQYECTTLFTDSFPDGLNGITLNSEPEFVENIRNVTVPSGREAILSCVVSNLGKFKVGWIRAEDQTILTLDSKVVTHNNRVSVTHDGVQTWNLHLRQVRQSDRGCYMCQINTAIMKKQFGCIDVLVSPTIVDGETSSDLTVREGDNATLFCRARGHPPPKIIWKREDGEKIILRRGFRDVYKGYENITAETLHFIRLERRQMGTFLCIASNDVPPAVSKRITLDVNFSPLIKVPSQLLGAPLGDTVVLECHVEACPKAFSYWMKNRGEMLIDGSKYIIEERRISYKVNMKLTIKNFSRKDIGIYNCLATNSIGRAEESIRVHGFSTSPMSTDSKGIGIGGGNGFQHHHFHKISNGGESQWNFAVAPRDSLDSSPNNQNSRVKQDSDGRERSEISSSSTKSISSSSSKLILTTFFFFQCFLTIKRQLGSTFPFFLIR